MDELVLGGALDEAFHFIEKSKEVHGMLVAKRERARYCARVLAMALEHKLKKTFGDELIRDMPNLNPPASTNEIFHAVRLRGRIDAQLKTDEPTLVFTKYCKLTIATAVVDPHNPSSRKVVVDSTNALAEFVAEDLKNLVERLSQSLSRHLTRVRKTTSTYREVEAFSEKLAGVLGVSF